MSQYRLTLKGKNLLPQEQIISFMNSSNVKKLPHPKKQTVVCEKKVYVTLFFGKKAGMFIRINTVYKHF